MLKQICFEVTERLEGLTVGHALRQCGVSLTRIRSLKRIQGGITLDGQPVYTDRRVVVGQTLAIALPQDARTACPTGRVVDAPYQDDQVMVLDKPPFMTVHPVKEYRTDTLANAFAALLERKGQSAAFRPLNRLDRNTSGLVVAAMNPFAAAKLAGKVEKEYLAIVHGRLAGRGRIDAPLRRREGCGISREVGSGGQRAVTHWESLAVSATHSMLRLRLETGRTHQIRVHMKHMGFPLEGDTMYDDRPQTMERQALHCSRAWFEHPLSGERVEVLSPMPPDMQEFALLQGWNLSDIERHENQNEKDRKL